MTYTHSQKVILRDELDSLTKRQSQHAQSCLDCYEFGASHCPLFTRFDDERESIADALGYTVEFSEELAITLQDRKTHEQTGERITGARDISYTELCATYVGQTPDYDRWEILEVDPQAEHAADEADRWLASRTGQAAVTDLTDPRETAQGEAQQAWVERTLFDHTIWGVADSEATQGNLRAAARIWTTRRGEVGIFKTFVRDIVIENDSFSFHAYCSHTNCKQGFNFSGKRSELKQTIMNVVRHAHSHVDGTTLEFFDSGYVAINGTDAVPEPGTDRAADVSFVTRGLEEEYLIPLRQKWQADHHSLTQHELRFAKSCSSWLKSLTTQDA